MNAGLPIIGSKNYILKKLEFRGFGGNLYGICKSESKIDYVLKPATAFQGVNEIVAQTLLKVLGYPSIKSVWCTWNTGIYGATKYENRLTRIHNQDIASLTRFQKETFVNLYVINILLNNDDDGEYYIRSGKDVCCLDFGDAIFSYVAMHSIWKTNNKEYLAAILNQYSPDSIQERINTSRAVLTDIFKGNVEETIQIITKVLDKVSGMELSRFDGLLSQIEDFYNASVAEAYRSFLYKLKTACQLIKV